MNKFTEFQKNKYVLIAEAAFISLIVVQLGNLFMGLFPELFKYTLQKGEFIAMGTRKSAYILYTFELVLGPFLAGLWVAMWQPETRPYDWAIAGCFGLILLNIIVFKRSPAENYLFLIPMSVLAILGGRSGLWLQLKRRQRNLKVTK